MIIVMVVLKGDSFEFKVLPFSFSLPDCLVGVAPIFETLEAAKEYYPNAQYTEVQIKEPVK